MEYEYSHKPHNPKSLSFYLLNFSFREMTESPTRPRRVSTTDVENMLQVPLIVTPATSLKARSHQFLVFAIAVSVLVTLSVLLVDKLARPSNRGSVDLRQHMQVSHLRAMHVRSVVPSAARYSNIQLPAIRTCHPIDSCWECKSAGMYNCDWDEKTNRCEHVDRVSTLTSRALSQCTDTPPSVLRYQERIELCRNVSRTTCDAITCAMQAEKSPELVGRPCVASIFSPGQPFACNTLTFAVLKDMCKGNTNCLCKNIDGCEDAPGVPCDLEGCSSLGGIIQCPRTCGLCGL